MNVTPEDLALQRLYHWETHRPDQVVLSQPVGGGVVQDHTWRSIMDESRRMAAYLRRQGLKPGDRVALLSKNTAHWLIGSENLIGIAPKTPEQTTMTLSSSQLRQVSLLALVGIPGLAIVVGIGVWLRRRQ